MHTCEIMPLAFLSMIHFFNFLTQDSFFLSFLRKWLFKIENFGCIKSQFKERWDIEISDNQPYKRDLRDKFTHTKHCYAMVKLKIKNVKEEKASSLINYSHK